MADPKYKLTYFNVKGFGEGIRLIFAYSGVEYVRKDINFTDENIWEELKSTVPFGQLPVLEVDGKQLPQSIAICRYLAKKFGLLADDDWNNAHADATAITVLDLIVKIAAYKYEPDEERKKTLLHEVETVTIPFYYGRLNDVLKKHGHFAGKLTWVDFYVTGGIECIDGMMKKHTAEKYPFLLKLKDSILSLPNVKEYVATRPFNPDHDF